MRRAARPYSPPWVDDRQVQATPAFAQAAGRNAKGARPNAASDWWPLGSTACPPSA